VCVQFFPQNIVTPPLENENSRFGSRRHNDILVECKYLRFIFSSFFSNLCVSEPGIYLFFMIGSESEKIDMFYNPQYMYCNRIHPPDRQK
jgi:hypothetical protein